MVDPIKFWVHRLEHFLLLPLPPTSSRKRGAWHKTSLILLKGFVVALLKIKFPGRDFNRHNSNSFWRKKTVGAKWRVSCSMSWRVPKTSWKRQTQNLSRVLLRISHVGLKLLFSGRLLLLFGKCQHCYVYAISNGHSPYRRKEKRINVREKKIFVFYVSQTTLTAAAKASFFLPLSG